MVPVLKATPDGAVLGAGNLFFSSDTFFSHPETTVAVCSAFLSPAPRLQLPSQL